MKYAFKGAARPMTPGAFTRAAAQLGCEEAALVAVWNIECGGAPFRRDGTVTRRFEPHHMPRSGMTWRDSLKMPQAQREARFHAEWEADPEATAQATSWGGPQVMGFNAKGIGYASALAMVSAMADHENEHLAAFVAFVVAHKLDGKLRARDWKGFAKGYNGKGQPEVYARKIESEYRRQSGKSSPAVLKIGARGEAVKRLQAALGIKVDGAFGPATGDAVLAYQTLKGLTADGIAGAKTWEALAADRDAKPVVQSGTNPILTLIEALLRLLQGVQTA